MGRYKKYGLIVLVVLLAGTATWYFALQSGHGNSGNVSGEIYTCSMHPQIIRDAPGNCPICGMTLIRKVNNNQAFEGDSIEHLVLPPDRFVVGNHKIITPKDTAIGTNLNLPGTIVYDPSSAVNISARASGRIEKIYVKYKYQPVFKGQKLFDIYSPELLTEQQNFIYLLNNDAENSTIIKAAIRKLLLYGMTQAQINNLSVSRRASPIISIFSPVSGVVQGNPSNDDAGDAMESGNAKLEILAIKEGGYVTKNSVVFKLLDTNKVWAIFNVSSGEIGLVRRGLSINIVTEADNDDTIRKKIDFVEPQLNASDKTSRIRVYMDNNKLRLPVGTRLKGIVKTDPEKGIWLPKESVSSLGNRKIVFKKVNHGFKAMPIKTATDSQGLIMVIEGISVRDTIAAS